MKELDKIFSIKNFIDDSEKYNKLKGFWKDVVKETIGIEGESYVNNFYSNGKEILDGNPIYSALVKNEKGIRIIQIEVDPDEPMFATWIDKIKIHETEIEELVISLQLNFDTYSEAKSLIYLFSNNALTSSILLGVNEKYDVKWNLGKLSYAVHRVDYDRSFHAFRSLFESSIETKKFKLEPFKRFYHNYHQVSWHMISFIGDSPLHHSYNNFVKNIDLLNELVSINKSIDLDKINSKDYIVLILNNWGNSHNYIKKLHSYTAEAEKEFEFLKENFQ